MLSVAALSRHRPLLGRVHVPAADMGLVEQSRGEHHTQQAAHVVVHGALLDLARGDGGHHLVLGEPARAVARFLRGRAGEPAAHGLAARHLQVHAGVDRSSGAVRATPVGDDEALEAPSLPERLAQQERVLGAVLAVDLVVGVHHGPHPRLLDGRLEGREVDLVERAQVDRLVDAMALELLVIGGEVLDGGNDAFSLHAADVGDAHAGGDVGVLSVALEIPAPERRTLDVDRGSQDHVASQGLHLLGDDASLLLRQVEVPARRHSDARGKGRGENGRRGRRIRHGRRARPVAHPHGTVRHLDGWNPQPFVGEALHPSRAGQHPRLLHRRHAPEQVFDALVHGEPGILVGRRSYGVGGVDIRRGPGEQRADGARAEEQEPSSHRDLQGTDCYRDVIGHAGR